MEGCPVEALRVSTDFGNLCRSAWGEERQVSGIGNRMELDLGAKCFDDELGVRDVRDLVVLLATPQLYRDFHTRRCCRSQREAQPRGCDDDGLDDRTCLH